MKKKIITAFIAIGLAVIVVLVCRYLDSESYQYKRDMKNASVFYEHKEYEKAINAYLSILEKKEDEEATRKLVSACMEYAAIWKASDDDENARTYLELARTFAPLDEQLKNLYEEWFPGNACEEPVKRLVEGMCEADAEKMFSAFYQEVLEEYILAYEDAGYSEEEFYGVLSPMLNEDPAGYYVTESCSRLMAADVSAYEKQLLTKGIEAQVTDGYLVTITLYVYGTEETDEIPVFQIDGEWYVSHEFLGL